jgi:glutathione peroxidase-family protein
MLNAKPASLAVVSPSGEVVARFSPTTPPDAPEVVATIEQLRPA